MPLRVWVFRTQKLDNLLMAHVAGVCRTRIQEVGEDMDDHDFRNCVLAAIATFKTRHPNANLHLVYAPGERDPLNLVGDLKRTTVVLQATRPGVHKLLPADERPRFITLDCLRVAPYLYEADAGLDDPLFEASVTHALSQFQANDPDDTPPAVCGWWLSAEPADEVVRRLERWGAVSSRQPVDWERPQTFPAIWPLLDKAQRAQLLGGGRWLVPSVSRALRQYEADRVPVDSSPQRIWHLHASQRQAIDYAPLVADLVGRWHTMLREQNRCLPSDAEAQVLRHVFAARAFDLDGDNLTMYVMVVLQLAAGASRDAAFVDAVRDAADRNASLREVLRRLPEAFWERYTPLEQDPDRGTAVEHDSVCMQ